MEHQATPEYIAGDEALQAFLQETAEEPLLAVDTEAASFHRHVDRIYLIQVSTRTRTAIIDPLAVGDLSPFGQVLADSTREIIFHDGDYDLRLFDRQYEFHAANLFDTRIAAQFLNEPGVGLAALLAAHLGVTVDKRFQRADWSARPLSEAMLAYAAADTQHLPALRDLLRQRLQEIGRLSWCEEEFEHLARVRWTAGEDRAHGYLRLKGANRLTPRQLAVLRELWKWRDRVAERTDRAAFRILGNEAMLDLARTPVETLEELANRRGVGTQIAKRRGREILTAVSRGMKLKERDLPEIAKPVRHPVDREFLARLEVLKRVRNQVAARLGLAPGIVCPNGTLEEIARAVPRSLEDLALIPSVRRWQAATFGAELLDALGPAPAVKTP